MRTGAGENFQETAGKKGSSKEADTKAALLGCWSWNLWQDSAAAVSLTALLSVDTPNRGGHSTESGHDFQATAGKDGGSGSKEARLPVMELIARPFVCASAKQQVFQKKKHSKLLAC